ncbi:MAG: tetratricopeptide repeat protein, partial [Acidobacteriota bacterium]
VRAAHAHLNLGGFYYRRFRGKEARDAFQKAASAYESIYGPEDYRTAWAYGNLAVTELDLGRYLAAIETNSRALAIAEQAVGAESDQALVARCNLGGQYLFIGDLARAEELTIRCLDLGIKAGGANEQWILEGKMYLSEIRVEQGRFDLLEQTLEEIEQIIGSNEILVSGYSDRLEYLKCKARIALGDSEEAARACEASLEAVRALGNGPGSQGDFLAQLRLLEVEILRRDLADAQLRAVQLVELADKVSPLPYASCQFARLRGDLSAAVGATEEAATHYGEALEVGRAAGFLDTQFDMTRALRGLEAL